MFWPAARTGECPERRASGHQRFLLSPSEWQGRPAAGDDSGLALTSPTPGHWPPPAARKLAGEWHSQAAANLKIRRQLPLSSSPSPYSTPCFSFMLLLFWFFVLFCFVLFCFEASRKVLLIDQLSKCRKSEWVTSSEKYVELISTRSEEPRARRRLELLSPGNWQRLGFRGASASELS
ncbi:unnamed protein product [Rangifer tarandus platyrhynchus]|uniref:Uncharacterized protein n=2 Tax=Rangifer tarandus platyrhynchus TaxID=3082113 RepID=A0ABN8ZQN2_RANTA|nr:unnamed protein product [Rangifer tarandus platyrhynchus]